MMNLFDHRRRPWDRPLTIPNTHGFQGLPWALNSPYAPPKLIIKKSTATDPGCS